MTTQAQTYAARGIQWLQASLQKTPPFGVSPEYVGEFFLQYSPALTAELARHLEWLAQQRQQPKSGTPGTPAAPPPAPVRPTTAANFGSSAMEVPADEWTASARTAANLAAIRLLASGAPIGPEERLTLLRYSGWGGLSIEAVAEQLPAEWLPELRGSIHEYYSSTAVAREVARVLRPLLPTLPSAEGSVLSLEPAAGIGRLLHAFTGPGVESLRWTAVEYSHVSAQLLAAVRPDVTVYEGPFERWVAAHESAVAGKLGLVVSNPPYGPRGASVTEDPSKAYRERRAYAYFLRRVLDLLAPGGVGVFLVPYGFLTGRSAALVKLREQVLRRHHLMAAFRLPSRLFPGAKVS